MDEYKNISWPVTNDGDITIGRIGPVACAAAASDEDQCLAMLARRPWETLSELLDRLDPAIHDALENQVFADGIDSPG